MLSGATDADIMSLLGNRGDTEPVTPYLHRDRVKRRPATRTPGYPTPKDDYMDANDWLGTVNTILGTFAYDINYTSQ